MRSTNHNLQIISGLKGGLSDAQYLQYLADAVTSYNSQGGFPRIVQSVTTSGSQASITLNVPSGFTNVKVAFTGRSNAAVTSTGLQLQFNSDSGSNYDWNQMIGNTTTAFAGGGNGVAFIKSALIPGTSATATYPGGAFIYIPNYSGTIFYKTAQCVSVGRDGTTNYEGTYGGYWKNTAAITSVSMSLTDGNFVDGSFVSMSVE